ncbi:MAG: 4Fe-4S dicluster domain-containing protein [Dehalococcoidales bacterium]|nr:4Fe-4S dicluster domain-containing protein [Dehalococcoidales bacterium]
MKRTQTMNFVDEVSKIPGGEGVKVCMQCGTCTASCPSAKLWEYTPSEIIAMVRANLRDEVLSSSSMWACLSCYSCTVRCPRDVEPTNLFHILESLAVKYGYKPRNTNMPVMYNCFVNSIKKNGRVSEFGIMLGYYMSTNPFTALGMMPVAWKLLSHGRMPISAKRIKGRRDLIKIVGKLNEIRGV